MDAPNTEQILRKTLELWREIHRTMEQEMPSPWTRLNLSRAQLCVLILLYNSPELRPGLVADALRVPKANVTGIIEHLVQQRLVIRQLDLQDRRSHTLRLTEKGRRAFEELREWNLDRTRRVLKRIPTDGLRTLARSLEIMLAAAQQAPKQNAKSGVSAVAKTAVRIRQNASRRGLGIDSELA